MNAHQGESIDGTACLANIVQQTSSLSSSVASLALEHAFLMVEFQQRVFDESRRTCCQA